MSWMLYLMNTGGEMKCSGLNCIPVVAYAGTIVEKELVQYLTYTKGADNSPYKVYHITLPIPIHDIDPSRIKT